MYPLLMCHKALYSANPGKFAGKADEASEKLTGPEAGVKQEVGRVGGVHHAQDGRRGSLALPVPEHRSS